MENFTFELLLTAAGASAFVLLLLQVLWKTAGDTIDKDRFGPIISIVTGVIVVVVASFVTGNDPAQGVLTGITAGFVAMGLHDLGDSVGLPV